MAFCFTKHVGGEFDASQIGVGSRIYAEYTGPKNGVYLALSSYSGATHWARVDASEIVDLGNGSYGSYFDYAAMVKAWGDNFALLDQFTVFSNTASEVRLRKLAYFAGNAAPTDNSDGRWIRPDTGIAFIGDSICQNALLIYDDWNAILGRTDCCNYGIGGQTTMELVARIDELAQRNYSMVVFICGINDIGHGYTNEEIVDNFDSLKANSSVYSNGGTRFLVDGHHTTVASTILGKGTCVNMGTITSQMPSVTNVYWSKRWYEFGKTVIKIVG